MDLYLGKKCPHPTVSYLNAKEHSYNEIHWAQGMALDLEPIGMGPQLDSDPEFLYAVIQQGDRMLAEQLIERASSRCLSGNAGVS